MTVPGGNGVHNTKTGIGPVEEMFDWHALIQRDIDFVLYVFTSVVMDA